MGWKEREGYPLAPARARQRAGFPMLLERIAARGEPGVLAPRCLVVDDRRPCSRRSGGAATLVLMSDTLMISVSGMRGIVGKDLTPELVARHAAALGVWAARAGRPLVVLGRDARTSGPMFARAATAGLMSVGVTVIDVGIAPTPTVQLAVEHHHAGAGLILTASHNPIEWNALKFVGPDGIFLDGADGIQVRELAEAGPPRTGWDGVGAVREDPDAITRHLDQVLALPLIDVAAIRARRFVVALDCVRGAGGTTMPALLERLGCTVRAINLETDGHFPRPPEPVPENLGDLSRLVQESGAAVGFAVDPDVDRLALVDQRGEPIGEDYTLALAVRSVLEFPSPVPPPQSGEGVRGWGTGGGRQPVHLAGGRGRDPAGRRPLRPGPGGRGQRCPSHPG